jgi:hypothetical protein
VDVLADGRDLGARIFARGGQLGAGFSADFADVFADGGYLDQADGEAGQHGDGG